MSNLDTYSLYFIVMPCNIIINVKYIIQHIASNQYLTRPCTINSERSINTIEFSSFALQKEIHIINASGDFQCAPSSLRFFSTRSAVRFCLQSRRALMRSSTRAFSLLVFIHCLMSSLTCSSRSRLCFSCMPSR